MRSKSQRGIFLSIYKFDTHIDWAKFRMEDIEVELAKKGELDRSGRKHWTNNCANLRYAGELPEKYDDRIQLLIGAIGGEFAVRKLIRSHKPKDAHILLEIPAKSSDKNEEGYVSHETLKWLAKEGIDLHFWYI